MTAPPTRAIFKNAMPYLKSGQSVYVESDAKTCTAYASQFSTKITTAVCLLIEDPLSDHPTTRRLTRVTKI